MKYLVLLCVLVIAGCQKPSVYLYSKYISVQQTQKLSEQFEQAGYQVEINQLPFPQGITDTSILYSPLLQERTNLDNAVALLKANGLEISSVSSLVEGSHFVTKNALAVFVVFDQSVFATPVIEGQIYTTKNCDADFQITIAKDQSANVRDADKEVAIQWQLLANQEIIRLSDKVGRNYNYDIVKTVAATPVGVVDEVTLKPIVANTWFGKCEFYYGLVRTAS